MTTATATPLTPAPVPTVPAAALTPAIDLEPLWRCSVGQYHAMIEAGILEEGDPVELVEGLLVQKMTKHPPHALATELTRVAIEDVLPADWFVNVQQPITTSDSEPEPDVSVVRGQRRNFASRHPNPGDVGFLIEVSDDSLRRDRGLKKRAYARVSVPIYWIVNLVDRQVEVYTDPSGPVDRPDYRRQQNYGPADQVPVVIDGHEIDRLNVSDLLP